MRKSGRRSNGTVALPIRLFRRSSIAATCPGGSYIRLSSYTEMKRAMAARTKSATNPVSALPMLAVPCNISPPRSSALKVTAVVSRVRAPKNRPRRRSGTRSPIRLLHCGAARFAPARPSTAQTIRSGIACSGNASGRSSIGSHMKACNAAPVTMMALRCPVRCPIQADASWARDASNGGSEASSPI